MLSNLHTHTTFCDGSATAEELVLEAIEKGFVSLGFSGHAFAPYGTSWCMKDETGYTAEIERLKDKYKDKIEIDRGIEEDAFAPVDRSLYDYLIGSMHYIEAKGEYLPIDLGEDCIKKCLAAFGGSVADTSVAYYGALYVVGHFDLITKYDELREPYFLGRPEHDEIAIGCMRRLADKGFLFEVNTGAISRGIRKTPYPAPSILYEIRRAGGNIILNSDCHMKGGLDCKFEETKALLRDIGFKETTILYKHKFTKIPL